MSARERLVSFKELQISGQGGREMESHPYGFVSDGIPKPVDESSCCESNREHRMFQTAEKDLPTRRRMKKDAYSVHSQKTASYG